MNRCGDGIAVSPAPREFGETPCRPWLVRGLPKPSPCPPTGRSVAASRHWQRVVWRVRGQRALSSPLGSSVCPLRHNASPSISPGTFLFVRKRIAANSLEQKVLHGMIARRWRTGHTGICTKPEPATGAGLTRSWKRGLLISTRRNARRMPSRGGGQVCPAAKRALATGGRRSLSPKRQRSGAAGQYKTAGGPPPEGDSCRPL
jgi:hypothetical protein